MGGGGKKARKQAVKIADAPPEGDAHGATPDEVAGIRR